MNALTLKFLPKRAKLSIWALYAVGFLNGLLFWYAIEQLFIEELGGGVFEKGISVAVYALFYVLFNIPFGAISDRFGRKLAILLGNGLYIAAVLAMGGAASIEAYYLAMPLLAGAWAFSSGAFEGYLFETLSDHDQEEEYSRVNGLLWAITLIGAVLSNIASGFIAESQGLQANFFWSAIPLSIGLLVGFVFIHEPAHHIVRKRSVLGVVKRALHQIRGKRLLRVAVAANVMIVVVALSVEEFAQAQALEVTEDPRFIGYFWAAAAFSMAVGSTVAHRFERSTRHLMKIIGLSLLVMLVFGGLAGLLAVLVLLGVSDATDTLLDADVQENSEREMRSTVASVNETLAYILLTVLYVIGGWLGEQLSVARAAAILTLPFLVSAYVLYRRYLKLST